MDGALSRLEGALYRLLHHRSVREAYRSGQWDGLALPSAERAALAELDIQQVEQLATQIRADLLRRQHRGSGSLLTLYPATIKAWLLAHPDDPELTEMASRFMESEPYELYQEVAPPLNALSLEEAFFRFCETKPIGEPTVREDEFLTAIARALAVNARPSFAVPPGFRSVRAGWVAVGTGLPPKLYAAVHGRLLIGAITPFLAELIQAEAPSEEVACRHGADTMALKAALAELSALGLYD